MSNEKIDVNVLFKNEPHFEKTALLMAVEKDNLDIINLLISNNTIDLNILSKIYEGEHWKDINEYEEEEEEEEESTYRVINTTTEFTPLQFLIKNNKIEIFKLLLSNDNIDINTPGKITEITMIYPIGKEIKTTEKTAFQISIETENFEFINLLLENENLDVNYPYKITKNEFDERFVEKDFYSDSQAKSSTIEEISLLEMVIENRNIEMVQFLLSISNLDVNIANKYIERKPIFQEFIPVTIDTKSEIEEEEEEEEEEWLDDEIEIINENSNENELNEIKNEEEDDDIEEEEDKTDVSNDYDDEKYFQPFLSSEEQDLFEKMEENIEKDQKEWNEDIQYDDDIIETENEGEDENDRKIKYTDK